MLNYAAFGDEIEDGDDEIEDEDDSLFCNRWGGLMDNIPWFGGFKIPTTVVGATSPSIVVQWLHKLSSVLWLHAFFYYIYIYIYIYDRYYTHSIPAHLIHLSHLSSGIWLSYIV